MKRLIQGLCKPSIMALGIVFNKRQNAFPCPMTIVKCISSFRFTLATPCRSPSLLRLLGGANCLPVRLSALRSPHTLELLPEHGLKRIIASCQQHNVFCIDDFATGMFTEDLQITSGVCDLCVYQLREGPDELWRGVQI